MNINGLDNEKKIKTEKYDKRRKTGCHRISRNTLQIGQWTRVDILDIDEKETICEMQLEEQEE